MGDVEKDLHQIAEIICNCRKLTYDSYFMLLTDTSEKSTVIHRDKFLVRIRESFWKLAIIELAKLYGDNKDNDHFSVLVLIKHIQKHHSQSQWTDKISSYELKQIASSFKSVVMKTRIKKLKELRNQHYAHTDKNPDNNIFNVKLYYEDCFFLIQQIENVVHNLSVHILNEPIIFSNYMGEEMNSFINKHIEYMHRPY